MVHEEVILTSAYQISAQIRVTVAETPIIIDCSSAESSGNCSEDYRHVLFTSHRPYCIESSNFRLSFVATKCVHQRKGERIVSPPGILNGGSLVRTAIHYLGVTRSNQYVTLYRHQSRGKTAPENKMCALSPQAQISQGRVSKLRTCQNDLHFDINNQKNIISGIMEQIRQVLRLARDPKQSKWIAPLLLATDAILCAAIIYKIPCGLLLFGVSCSNDRGTDSQQTLKSIGKHICSKSRLTRTARRTMKKSVAALDHLFILACTCTFTNCCMLRLSTERISLLPKEFLHCCISLPYLWSWHATDKQK